jgi:2-oxo-4-hydroxy-4-carboxy-5-ureidoimidazoline decarboxylase
MTLNELNKLNSDEAFAWFSHCCVASYWCELMVESLPYKDLAYLLEHSQTAWQQCAESDFIEAFEGHPMIGDVASLRAKYAATKKLASHEQQGATEADEATLQKLHQLNQAYLAKHGFIFIICATGLSAQTMLGALQSRIDNDTATEITLAAAEQLKITQLRINKGLIT